MHTFCTKTYSFASSLTPWVSNDSQGMVVTLTKGEILSIKQIDWRPQTWLELSIQSLNTEAKLKQAEFAFGALLVLHLSGKGKTSFLEVKIPSTLSLCFVDWESPTPEGDVNTTFKLVLIYSLFLLCKQNESILCS